MPTIPQTPLRPPGGTPRNPEEVERQRSVLCVVIHALFFERKRTLPGAQRLAVREEERAPHLFSLLTAFVWTSPGRGFARTPATHWPARSAVLVFSPGFRFVPPLILPIT